MNFYINGKIIDKKSRCKHYSSPKDIIAIQFPCCNKFYACYECHQECEEHSAQVWLKVHFGKKAILCGVCKNRMSISDYLKSNFFCINCKSELNPKCKEHYRLYFEL